MSDFSSKKILIIDDDEGIHQTLSTALEFEGYETAIAKNGKMAMDQLNTMTDTELPNMVILDYWMPVMNGEEFNLKMKSTPRFAHIPVVMISAAGGNLVKVMEDCNTQGYVAKPMDINTILKITKYFTHSHHLNPHKTFEEYNDFEI